MGAERNERADEAAKVVAEDRLGSVGPAFVAEASLSHLRRATTERSSATGAWIRERVGRRHRYHPPPGGEDAKGAR